MRDRKGRDLIVAGLFLAMLVGASAGALWYLDARARRADSLPILHYEQPVFSEDESRVAYFRLLVPPGSDDYTTRQLWWTHRLGDERRLVAEFPPSDLRLLAWVERDSSILLLPPQPPEGPPTLIQVAVDGSFRRTIRFAQPALKLVGVRQGEVFFQRPAPGGVELLSWHPGQRAFQSITRFPASAGEQLELEEVAPSPDGRLLSVVICTGEPPSRGVWLYDRDRRALRYTFVSTEGVALRTAWSSDSRGLVAAAELAGRCELYLVEDLDTGQFTRLSAPARTACVPFWPRDADHFLLLEDNTVRSFHRRGILAEKLLDRVRAGRTLEDLAVSSRGNWAAYHSRFGPVDDLYVVSLKTNQTRSLVPPGMRRELQQTLWYQIGSGTRYAMTCWTGAGD
ncbi:MAG: hypothetical protein AB1758_20125 [Candidatus Eremiobacterota bacterium]